MISEKQKLAIVALAVLLVGEVIAVISIGFSENTSMSFEHLSMRQQLSLVASFHF